MSDQEMLEGLKVLAVQQEEKILKLEQEIKYQTLMVLVYRKLLRSVFTEEEINRRTDEVLDEHIFSMTFKAGFTAEETHEILKKRKEEKNGNT